MNDFAAAFDQEFAAGNVLGALDLDESEFADEAAPVPDLATDPAGLSDEFAAAMRAVGLDEATLDEVTEIVGDAAAHVAAERRQIAAHHPVAVQRKVESKFREWQVDTGPVFGPAGAETTVTIRPQARFRSEKIMATDDSTVPGKGTRILSVTVGQKVQRVGLGQGMLTQFFSAQALANGISFDTSSPWATISIRVLFVAQCNFELTIFGTVEIDE